MQLPKYKRILIKENFKIPEIVQELSTLSIVATDIETTSLDPYSGRIRLIQISSLDLLKTYIFDIDYITDLDPIRNFLLNTNIIKIFQNGVFDCKWTLHHLSQGKRKVFPEPILDVLLASKLLHKFGSFEEHKLGDIAMRYCGISLDKTLQKSEWGFEISEAQLEYSAIDCEVLFPIAEELSKRIENEDMSDAWRVENRTILATAMMELNGIDIDLKELKKIEIELDGKMWKLEQGIAEFLPNKQMGLFGAEPIALRSTQQMSPALSKLFVNKLMSLNPKEAKELGYGPQLQEINKNLDKFNSTKSHEFKSQEGQKKASCMLCTFSKLNPIHINSKKSETIKQYRPLEPKLIDMLCDYGTLSQAYSTYCLGIPDYVHKKTGKLHTELFQMGQPQHRYKAKEPNLLNIPRTDGIGPDAPEKSMRYSKLSFRNCFKAQPGRKLVIADYDGLQARLVAAHANERRMIKVFQDELAGTGPDIHTATAMFSMNLPKSKITKFMRQCAKSQNFALIFSAGAQRLKDYMLDSFGIALTLEEANNMRDKYFEVYHDLAAYHEKQRQRVQRDKRVVVKGGRAVLFTDEAAWKSYTTALNFVPVLGEVSGMKRALGDMARWLIKEQIDAFITLCVYDEMVINASDECAEKVARMMEKIMVKDMQMYCERDDVIITAKAKAVNAWADK